MLKVKVEPVEPAFYGKVSLQENPLTIAGYQVFCHEEENKVTSEDSNDHLTSAKTSTMMVDGEACIDDAISEDDETLTKPAEVKEHEDDDEDGQTKKAKEGMNVYVENDVMVDNNIMEEHVVEDGLVMVSEPHGSPGMIHVPYMETTPNEVLVIEEGADLMVGNMHSISSDIILGDSNQGYVIPPQHRIMVQHEEQEPDHEGVQRMDYGIANVHMLDERDCFLSEPVMEEQQEVVHHTLAESPQPSTLPSVLEKRKAAKSRKSPKKEKNFGTPVKKKKIVKAKSGEESAPGLSPPSTTLNPRKEQKITNIDGSSQSDATVESLALSPIQCKHPTLYLLLSTKGPFTLRGPSTEVLMQTDYPDFRQCDSADASEVEETPPADIPLVVDVTVTSSTVASHCQELVSKPYTSTVQTLTTCASNIPHSVIQLENRDSLSPPAARQDTDSVEAAGSFTIACENATVSSVDTEPGLLESTTEEEQQQQETQDQVEQHDDTSYEPHHETILPGSPLKDEVAVSSTPALALLASEGSRPDQGEAECPEIGLAVEDSLQPIKLSSSADQFNMKGVLPPEDIEDTPFQTEERKVGDPHLGDSELRLEEMGQHYEEEMEQEESMQGQVRHEEASDLSMMGSSIQEKYQTVRSSLQNKPVSKIKAAETLADRYMKEWKPTGRFQCKLCFYSCVTHNFLFRHWVLNHCSLRPYMCGHCGFQSATRDGVTRHQTAKHRGLTRRIFIDNEQQELLWNKFDEMFQGSGFVTESERRAQLPVTLAKGADPTVPLPSTGAVPVPSVAEASPTKGTILKVPQRLCVTTKVVETAVAKNFEANSTSSEENHTDRPLQVVDPHLQPGLASRCSKPSSEVKPLKSPRTNTVVITSIQSPTNCVLQAPPTHVIQAPPTQLMKATPSSVQQTLQAPAQIMEPPPSHVNHRDAKLSNCRMTTEVVASLKTEEVSVLEKGAAPVYSLLAMPIQTSTSEVRGTLPGDGDLTTHPAPSNDKPVAMTSSEPSLRQVIGVESHPDTSDTRNTESSSSSGGSSMYSLVQSKIEESFQHIKKRLMTAVPGPAEEDTGSGCHRPVTTSRDTGANVSA